MSGASFRELARVWRRRLAPLVRAWRHAFVWGTILAFGIAVMIFYCGNWGWLQVGTARVVTFCLQLCHLQASCSGDIVCVGGRRHAITPECTYIDWMLCAVPLIWRPVGPRKNLLRVGLLVTLVFSGNLLRLLIAIGGSATGHPRWLCHDLPDAVFWYPCLALLWWRWGRLVKALTARDVPCQSPS